MNQEDYEDQEAALWAAAQKQAEDEQAQWEALSAEEQQKLLGALWERVARGWADA